MNWPKIKTALICLFLAIDIFLAGWDIALRRGKSRVSDEVVENTVSLLADRTITVSPALISRSAPRITTVTAKNPMADEAGFIGKILGTGAQMFRIAGPVLVYGSAAAVIYGVIYYIFMR